MEDRQSWDCWDWLEEVGLEGNDRSCDWVGLVVLVSVSVHTQLLRDLLADSHWSLLVDFVTNFVGNVLSEREQFLSNNNDELTLQTSYGFCAHFLSGISLHLCSGTSTQT